MMAPRPTSPIDSSSMNTVCGRESSVSPPSVVAPLPIKPTPLSDGQALPVTATDQQQRLLYQLALAERLRIASAGLAWARPPLLTQQHHPHHLQEPTAGSFMGGNLMGGIGFPVIGGLGSVPFGGGVINAGSQSLMSPANYAHTHPLYGYRLFDPRMLLPRGPEEPKPQHSYIGLIAMAILSSPDKKLILSDIYQYILDNYPYFRSRGTGWRNSIRHNLSLNDCFMKSGRSANGKGHYWAIHPANIDDFRRGDFRRRRAQRRVRKHMGLAVDDDSEPETLSPPPPPHPPPSHTSSCHDLPGIPRLPTTDVVAKHLTRPKRQFDVLSLLAPDIPRNLAATVIPDNSNDDPIMDVSSVLNQNQIHLPTENLRVIDDLRLQMREIAEESVNHQLLSKNSLTISTESEPCQSDKILPLRVPEVNDDDDDDEVEDVERKCHSLFNNSQKSSTPSSVGITGGMNNQGLTLKQESSSPLQFLTSPWHSPTSSLITPISSSSSSSSSSIPMMKRSSPTLHFSNPEFVSSTHIHNCPPNLNLAPQTHVSKPIPNIPTSSSHTLSLTPNINKHFNPIPIRTTSQTSNVDILSLSMSQGSALQAEH